MIAIYNIYIYIIYNIHYINQKKVEELFFYLTSSFEVFLCQISRTSWAESQ